MPFGLHAILKAADPCPGGAIFVLKNRNGGVNIDNQNRLHPFYMVYVSDVGEIVCDHLSPKQMLDDLRLLCKGNDAPHKELCRHFNQDTKDGRDMRAYSRLLEHAIHSIVDVKAESDIDSLFKSGGTSALNAQVNGLDDFELISFFVVRQEN